MAAEIQGPDDNKIKPDNDNEDIENNESLTRVDIAFVLDCTQSMNPYIDSARNNIVSISNKIDEECKDCIVSFGLVLYRDIPKEYDILNGKNNANGFITEIFDFTSIPFQIELKLHSVDAMGGGDLPEALTSALYSCLNQLKWNKNSIKVIIIITDAPPHGLEVNIHDYYPNDDINTFIKNDDNEDNIEGKQTEEIAHLNILNIIKLIRNKLKASIYSVVCEPNISCNFDFAHDFFRYIAETTNGKFLPLSKAQLLPNVIVGSVKQQISVHHLSQELEDEIKKIKKEYNNNISNNELNKLIKAKWKDKHIKKKDISIGTLYRKQRPRDNIELLLNHQKIKTLADFKKNAKLIPRYTIKDFRHINKKKNIYIDDSISNKANNSNDLSELSISYKENDDNNIILKQSFDDLLKSGHDIDGINDFVHKKSKKNSKINISMLLQKKSRYIGAWRKRYIVLINNGILKTYKSKEMKKCTETIDIKDIKTIKHNESKFTKTEFHIICHKITFQFKAENIEDKMLLINAIKLMRSKQNKYDNLSLSAEHMMERERNLSLSMCSQRAYSYERSVDSRDLSWVIRRQKN